MADDSSSELRRAGSEADFSKGTSKEQQVPGKTSMEGDAGRLLLAQFAQMAQNQGTSNGDPMFLANSDGPGTVISSILFNGKNFPAWHRQVRMGLKTKSKLGFLDGTLAKPEEDSLAFFKWSRADGMVACWILGSMTPELSGTFIYTGTARDLWLEILERYCQSNAPMVYQWKIEILRTVQGNSSVTSYYSKLKHCWEEVAFMNGISSCTCGALGKCICKVIDRVLELESQDRLMQFLANLNSDYEAVKGQILATDPLPSVNKAYYLVLQVEKQKEIGHSVPDSSAFMAGNFGQRRSDERQSSTEKKEFHRQKGNEKKFCTNCNKTGHLSEECFELIGFPDWYKGKKKTKNYRASNQAGTHIDAAHFQSPLDTEGSSQGGKYSNFDPEFVQAMCEEMMKVFNKGKAPAGSVRNYAGLSE